MAKHSGEDGKILIGANEIGELENFTLDTQSAVASGRAKGDAWTTNLPTGKSWSFSVSCFLDEADAGQITVREGDVGTAKLYTDGDDSGKTEYSGAFVVTGVQRQSPIDGLTRITINAVGNGALAEATVS